MPGGHVRFAGELWNMLDAAITVTATATVRNPGRNMLITIAYDLRKIPSGRVPGGPGTGEIVRPGSHRLRMPSIRQPPFSDCSGGLRHAGAFRSLVCVTD